MASFAAVAYRPSGGRSPYIKGPGRNFGNFGRVQAHENKEARYAIAKANYNIAKNNYNKAKKAYNNQKRSVSGGLRGWINRRRLGAAGQQARNNRNRQLNSQLKTQLNAKKAALNKVIQRQNYKNAMSWYSSQIQVFKEIANNAAWKEYQKRRQ